MAKLTLEKACLLMLVTYWAPGTRAQLQQYDDVREALSKYVLGPLSEEDGIVDETHYEIDPHTGTPGRIIDLNLTGEAWELLLQGLDSITWPPRFSSHHRGLVYALYDDLHEWIDAERAEESWAQLPQRVRDEMLAAELRRKDTGRAG